MRKILLIDRGSASFLFHCCCVREEVKFCARRSEIKTSIVFLIVIFIQFESL